MEVYLYYYRAEGISVDYRVEFRSDAATFADMKKKRQKLMENKSEEMQQGCERLQRFLLNNTMRSRSDVKHMKGVTDIRGLKHSVEIVLFRGSQTFLAAETLKMSNIYFNYPLRIFFKGKIFNNLMTHLHIHSYLMTINCHMTCKQIKQLIFFLVCVLF